MVTATERILRRMKAYEKTIGDLNCVVLDGDEDCTVAVVVCHGYGAPGDDLVPLGAQWAQSLGAASDRVRFVFPYAPHTLAELGMPSARAWWELNMQRLMLAVEARQFAELHVHEPPGLDTARAKLTQTVAEVMAGLVGDTPKLMLGGFSQGAMLSMDVALRGLPTPPDGLLQMSGTLICKPIWEQHAGRLVNTEVLQSHGTADPILPFESAEALRDVLSAEQVPVQFLPFPGPHTIGPEMIASSTDAIARLVASS